MVKQFERDWNNKEDKFLYRITHKAQIAKYKKEVAHPLAKEKRNETKKLLIEYKGGKCVDCDLEDEHPSVYDFHHLRDKEFCISIGITKLYSLEKLKKEVDKCILLCSNCHRKRTNL